MVRVLMLLLAVLASTAASAQMILIEDQHDDAALFVVPTALSINPPQPVHSLTEYESVYGRLPGIDPGALAATLYFANGGQTLYVADPGAISDAAFRQALSESTNLPVSVVAMPGASAALAAPSALRAAMQVLIEHVEASPNRFAVLDAPKLSDADALLNYRNGLQSKYAALYAPWLIVDDANAAGGRWGVAPSAAVAGVIARTDRTRGIFKAPAGTDAMFAATLHPTLERDLATAQNTLNSNNVNLLRSFAGYPQPVIWGARVLSTEPGAYVPVHRYLRHLKHSIEVSLSPCFDGTLPTCIPTATTTNAAIDAYLLQQWQKQALQGATPQEAWFSHCSQSASHLECQFGVALTRPAEFEIIPLRWVLEELIFQSGFE
ncbi:phage tail sheath subtilisin-like domain-containing protein [Xanthomonadaceae bacterium JHOS43]|nr:phage tail sheath subtilisin-like domain-containing protein [Xanthomonadaceae bacterium JHOS43]MCX7563130.1 phage tail sheath subtilisin-like domain-containing protein [Xanthomonadaceae bacterium XH05]